MNNSTTGRTQYDKILSVLKRRPKSGIDNDIARSIGVKRLSERIFEMETKGFRIARQGFSVKKNGQRYRMTRYVLDSQPAVS